MSNIYQCNSKPRQTLSIIKKHYQIFTMVAKFCWHFVWSILLLLFHLTFVMATFATLSTRGSTLDVDVCRRQNLTSKVNPTYWQSKTFIMTVDPQHKYSNWKKTLVSMVYIQLFQRLNPLHAKLFNLNFHPLEVLSRWRDPQLQVSENYLDLTKWRSTVFKYCWLMSHLIFNMFKRWYLMC